MEAASGQTLPVPSLYPPVPPRAGRTLPCLDKRKACRWVQQVSCAPFFPQGLKFVWILLNKSFQLNYWRMVQWGPALGVFPSVPRLCPSTSVHWTRAANHPPHCTCHPNKLDINKQNNGVKQTWQLALPGEARPGHHNEVMALGCDRGAGVWSSAWPPQYQPLYTPSSWCRKTQSLWIDFYLNVFKKKSSVLKLRSKLLYRLCCQSVYTILYLKWQTQRKITLYIQIFCFPPYQPYITPRPKLTKVTKKNNLKIKLNWDFCVTPFSITSLCRSIADIWPFTTLLLGLPIVFSWSFMKPVKVKNEGFML